MKKIDDQANSMVTDYSYDLAGNRTTEKQTYRAPIVMPPTPQNNTIVYDMQNRVEQITDDTYTINYEYDDRIHVRMQYDKDIQTWIDVPPPPTKEVRDELPPWTTIPGPIERFHQDYHTYNA